MKLLFCFGIAFVVGTAANAQPGTGFTIQHNPWPYRFTQGDSPTDPASAGPVSEYERFSGYPGISHIDKLWFWYRTPGDTRENAFHSATNVIYGGSYMALDYEFPTFNARLIFDISAPSTLYMYINLINVTNQVQEVSIFSLTDLNVMGTVPDDVIIDSHIKVVEPGGTEAFETYSVIGSGYQYNIGEYGDVLGQLTDGDVDDFTNTPGPGTHSFNDLAIGTQRTFNMQPLVNIDYDLFWHNNLVPEPQGLVVLSIVTIGVLMRRRRRST